MKTFLRMMLVVFALFLGHMTAFAQRQISGTVNDPAGNPLVGVGVVVRGTTSGTVTDLNGSYSLSVPENATLLFSCIGYSDEERDILPGQNVYNVVLTESSELLSESVAVGYGSITKRSLSTAISTVKGDKIADLPTSTMAQALAGMSSGITLQQISGDPGTAPAIRIRGAGSINSGNDPLYVIDGYPTTDSQLFNNLNPSDIADIQIMKDAASSAIYGSKAGNGVIIVTTKQGSEGKAKVSFSTQIGISQPQNYVDVLNATDFLDMIIEARTNNGTIGQFPDIVNLRSKGNYPDTDWQKEVFRNALNQRYNVSVTGGTSAIRYNVSAGIQDEDGILLNSYFKKYNINAGFDADLNDYVK